MDGKNLNSRFAADVAHLCKLSVRHVGAHLGCEISCRYVAISTVPSFKYFVLWIFHFCCHGWKLHKGPFLLSNSHISTSAFVTNCLGTNMVDSNRRQDKSHVGENQEYDPPASVDRKTTTTTTTRTTRTTRTKTKKNIKCSFKLSLYSSYLDLDSIQFFNLLLLFNQVFFHMPYLCSYFSGNQIENLPPGVFTNNTELTEL